MLSPIDVSSDLKKLLEGEVLDQKWQRSMYATDASLYEILPLCIVIPKTERDVITTVKYAYEKHISVTPRGGGTALAGQSVSSGIIIDLSKYLNAILEVASEEGYVIVEPGVNKSELDRHLKDFGKFFPPDPSSSDFCTIGGMIANNSGGPHTVKYGSVIDYVISVKVALSNGEVIETRPVKIGGDEWHNIVDNDTQESKIYREVNRLIKENTKIIREKAPKVTKNCSGYRLDTLLRQEDTLDLGRIFAASEGTLGIVLQAKLRILDAPLFRGTVMLQFDSLEKMGRAVSDVLKTNPSAVELLDHHVIRLASNNYPELKAEIPDSVKAVLLVEFDGMSSDEVEFGMKQLEEYIAKQSKLISKAEFAYTLAEAEKFWSIRKKSLPYTMNLRKGGRRPVPFIEDVVVQPERLAAFIRHLYDIYEKYGVEGVIYGHAGDGQLHTRPLLDMKEKTDIDTMTKIADEVFNLVIEYRGSITGEHGDGLVRSRYVEQMFGSKVYKIFNQVKSVFDPTDIMNPGKKMTDDPTVMTQNLRYGPSYRRRPIKTTLNWNITKNKLTQSITGYADEFTYEDEVELCHGCGTCRELTPGRMCPVFKAYHGEVDSCRGRLSILRGLLKTDGLPSEFELTDEYRGIIYDHCVQCRMCHIECPSNVNVGKLMAEARARYSAAKSVPKGYRYFADIDRYGELGSRLAPLSNLLFQNSLFRLFLEWFAGIDKGRVFPSFSRQTFAERFREYKAGAKTGNDAENLVFFYDTYLNYNNPDLGISIVKMLEKNGYNVLAPPQKSSGLPALLEGDLHRGREMAEYNVANLSSYVEKGFPIVTFSPSSGVALKSEYLSVLDTPAARAVADSTFDIHEFLYMLHKAGKLMEDFKPVEKDIYVHLHCHDIVQKTDEDVVGLLCLLPGLKFDVLESGCCGMGGAYGFVKGNYERSLKMGEPLFDAVKSADRPVYSTGELCALQMEAGSGRRVGLTVDLLREAYGV